MLSSDDFGSSVERDGLPSDAGVVSEPWAVYSGRVALVVFGGWRAVRLLPRRPLIEALIEMAEQLALHRGLRHGVVGAA